jgi:hypothetical protein
MTSPRIAAKLAGFALAVALVSAVGAQSEDLARTENGTATIRSIRALPSEEGWAVEVISTGPLVPSLSWAENPPRLIIDLPHAHLSNLTSRLAFASSGIAAVRVGQFQTTVARIVVDLVHPVRYSWDAAGNRLTIRVRPAPSAPRVTPVASHTVIPASRRVVAGSQAAVLPLGRRGQLRVCPGTTVSVIPSQSGRALLLAMGTGGLEAHYALGAAADSVLTPDFRILPAGRGEFDYAISADRRGNTCVRALPGNRTPAIVSELLGSGSYQVKPSEQVVFRAGQLQRVASSAPGGCGCAAMPEPNEHRETKPTSLASGQQNLANPETAPLPPSRPNDLQIQVDSSFVFRGNDPGDAPLSAQPANQLAELLPARSLPPPAPLETVLPPPKPRHRGFLGKIKGFFSAMFG